VIRYLIGICAWAGGVLSLGGCSYSEEVAWRECCYLHIVGDETSSPEGRKTIIEWDRGTTFGGDGVWRPPVGGGRWKKQQIASALTDFLAGNPGSRPSDYFASLGMTCRPAGNPKDDLTRCEIDLPVWVQCTVMMSWPFYAATVPKELRKPIPAILHVSVSASASPVLDTSAQVIPVPGGRLCHR
jgi:hypothetical protein